MHGLLFNVNRQPHQGRPAGVYRIAHVLREQQWDIEVIEYAFFWDLCRLKELARNRINTSTKFIGFGHLFSTWNNTLEEFCGWIKATWPDLAIISGASVNPMFTSKYIDYYVQGYGEIAIVELLKYICGSGRSPVFTLAGGGRKIIPAISAYPAFPMKNLMIKYQPRDFVQPWEWLTIEFARGCKFACTYCNYPVLGVKDDSTRDAEDFREQVMHAYDNWGTRYYMVGDETFNDRTEKIKKFADVVETLPFDTWFTAFIRADLLVSRPLDRVHLARMRMLGHFYGVESFNHESAKIIGKGMEPQRLQQGLLDVNDYFRQQGHGYRATIGLIIGLPQETIDSLEKTKQWLVDHWQEHQYVVSVLEIPVGDLDKPSKMSLDYSKYGYEPMDSDDRDLLHHYGDKLLKWKNPQMDVLQAQAIEQDFISTKYQHDFHRGAWSLTAFSHINDIKEILKIKENDPVNRDFYGNEIERYIQRKINC